MKVINNTLSFSPDGITSGNTLSQGNILFQDFLLFLLSYLNQGDSELIKNFDLGLLQQGKAEDFHLENPLINLFQTSLDNPGEQSFFVKDFTTADLERLKVNYPVMDNQAGEEKRANSEGTPNLSLYSLFALIWLERIISSDAKDLNATQGSVFNNTESLGRGWRQLPSLDSYNQSTPEAKAFNSTLGGDILDLLRKADKGVDDNILEVILKRIGDDLSKGASRGMDDLFQDLRTFIDSGLPEDSSFTLSDEARVFFKNYLDSLQTKLKEGDAGLQGKPDFVNIKEGFSSLSEKTQEEVKNFVQQIKEVIVYNEKLNSPQEEATVQRFILSEQGKPLLLKVKTLEVKVDSPSDSRMTDLIHNPVVFYSKAKELNPTAERIFTENMTLPPRIEIHDVHRFIKDFTVEIAPSGERKALVQLEPPELGRMEIKVHVHDGEVEIRAQVEKPETLAQLQQDLSQIKTQLEDLGLRLKDLQISLGLSPEGRSFGNNEERDNSKKHNRNGEISSPQVEGVEQKPPLYHQGRLYRIV